MGEGAESRKVGIRPEFESLCRQTVGNHLALNKSRQPFGPASSYVRTNNIKIKLGGPSLSPAPFQTLGIARESYDSAIRFP